MTPAYIPNTMPLRPLTANTSLLLQQSLEQLVRQSPPLEEHNADDLMGLAAGHTALAYLFLQMARRHPDLHIDGQSCTSWAQQYIAGDRGSLDLSSDNCGFVCEKLAFEAARACITRDQDHVSAFLANIPIIADETGFFPDEMLYGRAAVLHMLRMVRTFVPSRAEDVNAAIRLVSRRILASERWTWLGKRFYGAPHGDIGIVTQLVLSDPSTAPGLTARLEELLALQDESGNWPDTDEVRPDGEAGKRVQFCHGAPGFIFSLQSLRPFYPALRARIDEAIERGRRVTWTRGLVVKQPSLCHGLFGNGLAFEKGQKREHFLALATPDSLEALRRENPGCFEGGDYGMATSPLFSHWPSAAWTWTVWQDDEPSILLFNDV